MPPAGTSDRIKKSRGISAVGSASPWHGGGHGFESRMLHQSKIIRTTSSQLEMGSELSCEFNVDTARVELKYSDSSMLSIDCDGVEDEYAKTIRQRSALDYLVYNAPLEYAELVLCGDVEGYLRNVTDYRSFNEWE